MPIEPSVGIGPIKLLSNVFDLRKLILKDVELVCPSMNHCGDWDCRFAFPDWVVFRYRNALEVVSNIYTGLIVRINLFQGYKGQLWSAIGIGSLVRDLVSLRPNLSFDENILTTEDDFSIQFEIDSDDVIYDLAEVMDNRIVKIAICAFDFESLPYGALRIPDEWKQKATESLALL